MIKDYTLAIILNLLLFIGKKKNPSQYNRVSHRSLNYSLCVRKCLEKKMSFSRKSLSLESDTATLGSLEGTDVYFHGTFSIEEHLDLENI